MANLNDINIIILAAGHGKRMQSELPKVLVPLHGKPLITHVLTEIKNTGLTSTPVIVVGQQRELVMQTLGSDYKYAIQEEQLGTGHAVMSAKNMLPVSAKHVMVLYGDHPFISAKTIKMLMEKHLNSSSQITMATVKLPDFEEWRNVFYSNFGRIIRDEHGEISKIVEFKDTKTDEEKNTKEVNPSYFCFDAQWLWENLKKINRENAQKEYYLTDLVKIAMQEKIKIESISIDPREALGANSKEELETLERLKEKM